jgi:flagellar biosynthesis protein FlhF
MDIRTFEARTMKEALAQVRAELGPEAVILQSREVRKRRLFGMAGSHAIEITAGTGMAIADRPRADDANSASQTQLAEIHGQVKSLRGMVEDLCRRKKSPIPDLPPELVSIYTRLVDGDVHEPIASGLVCQLRDELGRAELARPESIRARLVELVRGCVNVSGPIVCESGRCKIVTVVGPTGVGKTSTVAKLAANFKLRQQLRVGLVTADTFRIAAVEQLRTYAEIIDAPIKVASSPREMAEALAEFSDLDLVLIDTVGRSPRDELRIKELKAFLQEAAAAEVHLVLSAVASSGSLLTAVERFSAIGASRLLFCKLDEAASLGGILSSVVRTGQPVSYLGDGQDVPDNIDIADAGELAEKIVDSLLPESVLQLRRAA